MFSPVGHTLCTHSRRRESRRPINRPKLPRFYATYPDLSRLGFGSRRLAYMGTGLLLLTFIIVKLYHARLASKSSGTENLLVSYYADREEYFANRNAGSCHPQQEDRYSKLGALHVGSFTIFIRYRIFPSKRTVSILVNATPQDQQREENRIYCKTARGLQRTDSRQN